MPKTSFQPNFDWESVDSWLEAQIKTTNYSQSPAFYLAQAQKVFELAKQKYALQLPQSITTVTGTNGKGSTVLLTAQILAAQGSSVATLTSPHLDTVANRMQFFNPTDKSTNQSASKAALLTTSICELMQVEGYQQLGWYQKVTLACLVSFCRQKVDFWVLEVGLGGKYDAVRVVQCDIAVVTSIADDHLERLGPTMVDLAREKAGISMGAETAMYFGNDYTEVFQLEFANYGVPTKWVRNNNLYLEQRILNREVYHLSLSKAANQQPIELQVNHRLPCESVCAAIMIVEQLLGANIQQIEQILHSIQITGRLQKMGNILFDVSHNVSSVTRLTEYLTLQQVAKNSLNVLVCLKKTKDLQSIISLLLPFVNHWHLYQIDSPIFYSSDQMIAKLQELNVSRENITIEQTLPQELTITNHQPTALVINWLVFGSFLLVAPALNEFVSDVESLDLQLTKINNVL